MKGHTGGVHSVAFSPCGKQIASASHDRTIRLWSSETGECLFVLNGHEGGLTDIAFCSTSEMIASSSMDRTVRLWNSSSGQLISRLLGHGSWITTCTFSPDGLQFASGDLYGIIRLWEVNTNLSDSTTQKRAVPVRTVAYSHNDGQRLVLGTEASSILLWDPRSDKPDVKLEGHTGAVYSVTYSPCGKWILSGSRDKTVRLWSGEVDSWSCVAVVRGCSEPVTSVAWNPVVPMEFVTGIEDGSVRVWRILSTEAGDVSVNMHWSSHIGELCAMDLNLKGAIGLSPIYRKLLVQRGAIDCCRR
ncbi:WD40 repeat-like protein [Linnemannia elongata AG-77]|uniref:WD40 repeat-like protein n=1 Tax=Linnemannia elongata AG-77 TaxID=1314771 RepID=A0A197K5A2_9FUNG|nr:WD40 repeat-like protein [Linnemannia elongata AG-77]